MSFKKYLYILCFFALPCFAQEADDSSFSLDLPQSRNQALVPDDLDDYGNYGYTDSIQATIVKKTHEVFPDNIMKEISEAILINDVNKLHQVLPAKYASTYVNTPGFNRTTFIMIAAGTPNIDALNYLISMGADPNQKNDKGYNSLSAAMTNPYDEVLRILLQYNGNPNFSDHGKPLLWKAFEAKSLTKFQILLNANADTNFTVNAHSFLEELMNQKAYDYFYYALLHTPTQKIKFNPKQMQNNVLVLAQTETKQNKFFLSQIYFNLMQSVQ